MFFFHVFRNESTKVQGNVFDVVPFHLSEPNSDVKILVDQPLKAQKVKDTLKCISLSFKPGGSSDAAAYFLGEISHGVIETERMLVIGTPLLCIGELTLNEGVLTLRAPSQDFPFIITTMSMQELVNENLEKSRFLRNISILLGTVGMAFLTYKTFKLTCRIVEYLNNRSRKTERP